MESKRKSDTPLRHLSLGQLFVTVLALCLSATFLPTPLSAFDNPFAYKISRADNRLLLSFQTRWAFDEIRLPIVSDELWGAGNVCKAALVEATGQQFIASAGNKEDQIVFRPGGVASSSIFITPLVIENSLAENLPVTGTGRANFIAVQVEVRAIENRLAELTDKVQKFQQQNRCFSCHTSLPLVLAAKAAANRGYVFDQSKLLSIGRDIAQMQLADGSFFFSQEPAYGKIMTTLCAGAILALTSDFSPEFIGNLKKILPLVGTWANPDGSPGSDFFFRPLFIGQPTAALFESIIISTVYFRSFADSETQPDEQLRRRMLELTNWAAGQKNEAIHRRIVSMIGMPLLFQFSHQELPQIIRDLTEILVNEPEGKRRDIRTLAAFLLNRLDPENPLILPRLPPAQNLAEEIWECFEEIIQTGPGKKQK